MLYLGNRRSLTLIEFLVVICIILVLFGTFGVYIKITLRIARETALMNELNNIRLSVEHYRIINGKLPEDLLALLNQDFTFKISNGIIVRSKFLKPFRVDKEKYLLDPFMNRYIYNHRMGRVSSQTKGYESW